MCLDGEVTLRLYKESRMTTISKSNFPSSTYMDMDMDMDMDLTYKTGPLRT